MNLLLLKIKSFKLIRENFEKYIFIILLAFLLSRGILLDIPMSKNEEDYDSLDCHNGCLSASNLRF